MEKRPRSSEGLKRNPEKKKKTSEPKTKVSETKMKAPTVTERPQHTEQHEEEDNEGTGMQPL